MPWRSKYRLIPLITVFCALLLSSSTQAGMQASHILTARKAGDASLIARPAYYDGAQGPDTTDIIMFMNCNKMQSITKGSWTNYIGPDGVRWGGTYHVIEEKAHYDRPGELALNILDAATNNTQEAYALGWITHCVNDTYIHGVINEYGGDYATGKWRHKVLEQLEFKHVFTKYSEFVNTDSVKNMIMNPVPSDFAGFIFDAYHRTYPTNILYQDYAPLWANKKEFTTAFATALTEGHNYLAQFYVAHVNQDGDHSNALDVMGKMPYMPNSNEYVRLNNPLAIERDDDSGDTIELKLTIQDNRYYKRFLDDWEEEMAKCVISTREALIKARKYKNETNIVEKRRLRKQLLHTYLYAKDLDDPHEIGTTGLPGNHTIYLVCWDYTYRMKPGGELKTKRGPSIRALSKLSDAFLPHALRYESENYYGSSSGEVSISVPFEEGLPYECTVRAAVSPEFGKVLGNKKRLGSDWVEWHYKEWKQDVVVTLAEKNPDGSQGKLLKKAVASLQNGRGKMFPCEKTGPGVYTARGMRPSAYKILVKDPTCRPLDPVPIVVQYKKGDPSPAPPLKITILLEPLDRPQLAVAFTKASVAAGSSLMLTVDSPARKLDKGSLKASIDDKPIAISLHRSSSTSKILALHKFPSALPPGSHKVVVTVKDGNTDTHEMTGLFAYEYAMKLAGYVLDDTGGNPEDGNAHTGEDVQIVLKLISHEPGTLKDVVVHCPRSDFRLMPGPDKSWRADTLRREKETLSSELTLTAGAVNGISETVPLSLPVFVAGETTRLRLNLKVPVLSDLPFEVALDHVLDKEADGPLNNNNGKPEAGESVKLVLKVSNPSLQAMPKFNIEVLSPSSVLTIPSNSQSEPGLGSNASKLIKVAADVSTDIKQITTVDMLVKLTLVNSGNSKIIAVPITLYPMPLQIVLKDITVKDPDTGDLVGRNDNNKRLGQGEHAFLYVHLINKGESLDDVVVSLSAPPYPGLKVHTSMREGEGVALPKDETVELMFEIDVPIDYPKKDMDLRVAVVPMNIRHIWDGSKTLPVDAKAVIKGELTLLNANNAPPSPAELAPGSKLSYRLELLSTNLTTLRNLEVSLESADVRILPNGYDKQNLEPGKKRTYTGSLTIPKSYQRDTFLVRVECMNQSGKRRLYRKRFIYELGARSTTIVLASALVAPDSDNWKITIAVTDRDKKLVTEGVVLLKANAGSLSSQRVVLNAGRAEAIWTKPKGFTDQALIEIEYTGDKESPMVKDLLYLPSRESVILPPARGGNLYVEVALTGPRSLMRGADVTIDLVGPAGLKLSKNGRKAKFENLPPGQYKVSAGANSFPHVRASGEIRERAPGEIDDTCVLLLLEAQ